MRALLAFLLAMTALWAVPPQRVVSQTVGTDDLLLALAAPGQIAALSHLARDERYSPSFQEARKVPCLTNGEAEDILRHKPDLVLAASYTQPEVLNLLRRAQVSLLLIEKFESLEDTAKDLLGRARAVFPIVTQSSATVCGQTLYRFDTAVPSG